MMTSKLNVDNLIERLLEAREVPISEKFDQISDDEIKFLCEKSKEIFLSQPVLLELQAPINIC
ncbi:unnamed protein product, partial [Adineta steineri]